MRPHINSLTRDDLAGLCLSLDVPVVHAKRVVPLLYPEKQAPLTREDLSTPERSLDRPELQLPKKLARVLLDEHEWEPCEISHDVQSRYDGSVKFLVRLSDGKEVECVLMPEKSRLTLCLSSQVGCMRACSFCSTGKMGLTRNLESHEIVGQLVAVSRWFHNNRSFLAPYTDAPAISNVVFMGMGEPLDNLEAVIPALKIMSDPLGFKIPIRRIAVSTTGRLDNLERLFELYPAVTLAFSLHTPFARQRSQLMPVNRTWKLEEVMEFFRRHYPAASSKRRFLLVQYIMLGGINDSEEHALELSKLLADVSVKINLIPYNSVEGLRFNPPEPNALKRFRAILQTNGYRVMVRYSKGQDIGGACGQLITKAKKTSELSLS